MKYIYEIKNRLSFNLHIPDYISGARQYHRLFLNIFFYKNYEKIKIKKIHKKILVENLLKYISAKIFLVFFLYIFLNINVKTHFKIHASFTNGPLQLKSIFSFLFFSNMLHA